MGTTHNTSYDSVVSVRAKPRFKERHPFMFWVGVLVVGLSLFSFLKGAMEKIANGDVSRAKIAVIRVEGFISGTKDTLAWIESVRKDPSVKAAVLRVDSPGGGVAASEEIYTAIRRLNESKPVVASMGSVAASGGLFVSMGARKVVANATTLTGSIGVKMELPNLEGLMGKLGVASQTMSTGPLKDAGNMFRPMTEKEKEYLMGIMRQMNERFIEVIAQGRDLPVEKVREMADGRAFTGSQAKTLGLVDAVGDFQTAVELLSELSGIPTNEMRLYEKPQDRGIFLKELLRSSLGISVQSPHGPGYSFYY